MGAIAMAPLSNIGPTDTESYIPYEIYDDIPINAGWSCEHDFSKGLAKVRVSFNHGGYPYLIESGMFGGLSSSYKEGYKLIREELYPQPKFDRPSHMDIGLYGSEVTMPCGTVRRRGDNTGVRVLVDGKIFVLTERTFFRPLLPRNAANITVEEVTAWNEREGVSGWRAMGWYKEPSFQVMHDHVVGTYHGNEQVDDMNIVHFRKDGELHCARIDSFEDIPALLSIAANSGFYGTDGDIVEEQMGLF